MSGKQRCWLSGGLCLVGLAAGPVSAQEVSFAPVVHYPAGDRPEGLAACDFDGDGDLDLAVAGDDLNLLFNDGTGAFGDPVRVWLRSGSVACGDIDGDGDYDIVLGRGYISGNTLFINDGSGTFTGVAGPSTNPETGVVEPTGVALCDFDSDGDLDLGFATGAAYNEVRKMELFRNRGNGTFTSGRTFEVIPYWKDLYGIACADLEGDGTSDFIGHTEAYRTFVVLGFLPDGRFQRRSIGVRAPVVDVAFGELDDQPGVDAVVVHYRHPALPGRVHVLNNDGTGGLSMWLELEPAMWPGSVAVGYINSDGLLDIVVGDHLHLDVKVFLQEPDGFTYAGSFPIGHNLYSIICADLNGDGLDDVIDPGEVGAYVVSVLINTTSQPGP